MTTEWIELKHIGTSVYPKNIEDDERDDDVTAKLDAELDAEIARLEEEYNLDRIHEIEDIFIENYDDITGDNPGPLDGSEQSGFSSSEIYKMLMSCGMDTSALKCTCGGNMRECAVYHPKNGYTKKLIYWKCIDCDSIIGDYPVKV